MSTGLLLGAYITGMAVGVLAAGLVAAVAWSLSRRIDAATTLPALDREPDTQPIPLTIADLTDRSWLA